MFLKQKRKKFLKQKNSKENKKSGYKYYEICYDIRNSSVIAYTLCIVLKSGGNNDKNYYDSAWRII